MLPTDNAVLHKRFYKINQESRIIARPALPAVVGSTETVLIFPKIVDNTKAVLDIIQESNNIIETSRSIYELFRGSEGKIFVDSQKLSKALINIHYTIQIFTKVIEFDSQQSIEIPNEIINIIVKYLYQETLNEILDNNSRVTSAIEAIEATNNQWNELTSKVITISGELFDNLMENI